MLAIAQRRTRGGTIHLLTLLGGDAGDNFVVYSATVGTGTALNSDQVLTLDLGGAW